MKLTDRRTLVLIAAACVIVFVAVGVVFTVSKLGKPVPVDPLEAGRSASDPEVDPFAWTPEREPGLEAGAAAGFSHGFYVSYPDGVVAAARRTAALEDEIRAAAGAHDVDPALMEAMVLLESGGQPDAIAGGSDVSGAAGLAQIVASTGTDFLGMDIDVRRSQELTDEIAASERRAAALRRKAMQQKDEPKKARALNAAARKQSAAARQAEAERVRVDPRFDPAQALEGMATYLSKAEDELGREDLAVTSYHMGIGNLLNVIEAYGSTEAAGAPEEFSYAQLYFDTSPFEHTEAYDVLSQFADDSATYYWRVLAAREIMRLYREDQPQLARNVALQADSDSAEETFYPPATRVTFRDSEGLRDALASGELVSIPSGDAYGFEITPDVGALTRQRVDIGRGLYKTLTPAARATLLYLAARVQVITGAGGPKDNLLLTAATRDEEYERALGIEPSDFTLHTTGNSFDFKRKYRNDEQALAFQFVLDRLSALGVIAYTKVNDTIHVTVSPRADALLGDIEE